MPLDHARIRALCFDVDGTLRDTDDQLVEQIGALLSPIDTLLPAPRARVFARRVVMKLENPGTFLQSLTDRLDLDHHLNRLADTLSQLRNERRIEPGRIITGVPEMLAALHGRFPLAVVSARGQRSTQAFLAENDLSRFFQVIVTGQTCRHTKPYPDPVQFAARRMAVPVENCLMIGDTTVDIRAGRLAGAQTLGVLCGFGERDELEKAGADQIISLTPEILKIILQ